MHDAQLVKDRPVHRTAISAATYHVIAAAIFLNAHMAFRTLQMKPHI